MVKLLIHYILFPLQTGIIESVHQVCYVVQIPKKYVTLLLYNKLPSLVVHAGIKVASLSQINIYLPKVKKLDI